ncbi:MAG: 4-demethylwyosine synthase TYW1 [Candidatus Hodarchaeaceae archaeon]|nr:4-demethylwyosine synthase TYW1 [Candidatus Hodarchaeaceae archaeon]
MAVSAEGLSELERAGYRFVGEHRHSAVKVCHWTRKSLLNRGVCYKEQFYGRDLGVQSHRCLQLTPSLPFCDHRCVYCWRNIEVTSPRWVGEVDEPTEILDGAVQAQRQLLSGFKGNPDADKQKWQEAQEPKHCAISLAGEPTLYPKINEFIEECGRRRMTSFLVTNGQHPEVLEHLVDPTQLYISVVASDPETYKAICQPIAPDGWERLNRSLELMSSFKCRKVIRLTLVKGLNLKDAPGYAKLIEKAAPDFVEAKSYMWVGYSRKRLSMGNMPLHREIKELAEELARETGYSIVDESESSRVVLLKKK